MPSADATSVVGARPKHCTSGEYGTLTLEAPKGDQADGARVVGGDGTMGSSLDKEAMNMEE